MVTIADIICIVIFSTFVMKGNAMSIQPIKQNATVGRQGVLKCVYPYSFEEEPTVVYWKKNTVVICYELATKQIKCEGLKHNSTKGQIILTIPAIKASDAGSYTCSVFTKDKSFECNIDLVVQSVAGRLEILLIWHQIQTDTGKGEICATEIAQFLRATSFAVSENIQRAIESNGSHIKAGLMFQLLPLALVIWRCPFISL